MNSQRETLQNQSAVDMSLISQQSNSVQNAFEPDMAVLVSSDVITLDVVEGRDAVIEFTVENKSSQPWPFKPFVQNERDKAVKQHVDCLLAPG